MIFVLMLTFVICNHKL